MGLELRSRKKLNSVHISNRQIMKNPVFTANGDFNSWLQILIFYSDNQICSQKNLKMSRLDIMSGGLDMVWFFLAMAYEVFSCSSHFIFRFKSRCSPSKPTMAQTQKSSTLDFLWSCFFFKFVCLFFYLFVFLLCVLGPRGDPSAFCGRHCYRRLQRSVYFYISKNNIKG